MDDSADDASDDPPPVAPRKAKKKRKKKPARRRVGLVIGLAAAAVVVIGVVGGIWLLGGGSAADAALRREPKSNLTPGNPSTVYPHEFPPADRAGWKVQVEAADPAPANLLPAVPCLAGQFAAVTFADPKAAAAAVVLKRNGANAVPWQQISLIDPAATRTVQLTDPAREYDLPEEPGEVALSPAGDRLATAFNGNMRGKSFGVVLWGRDGRKQGEWEEGKFDVGNMGKREIRGLWFAGPDRLLVLAGDKLRCREVSTGKLVYERPLKLAGDAVLTPRRTWLLAGVEGGVEAIATADGTTAGRLTVPGFHTGGTTQLAVSPDGSRLAAIPFAETGLPLVVWSLADGVPVFARLIGSGSKWLAGSVRPGQMGMSPVQWAGDRQVVLGGKMVFDLDLGGAAFMFGEDVRQLPATGPPAPDGRLWRVVIPPPPWQARFAAAAKVDKPGGAYLTATAVPPTAGGLVWGPLTSVRVDCEGASGHSSAVKEALADGLADRGFRVDPAAELTVHFIGVGLKTVDAAGLKRIDPKWDQRLPPGTELRERIDGYEVTYRVELRDGKGRKMYPTGAERPGSSNNSVAAPDHKKAGKVHGWQVAAKEAAGSLPVELLRLAPDAAPVKLPQHLVGRPDGTAEVVSP